MVANRTLVIGDKRISSWSMRPWVALTHAGIDFEEQIVRLYRPETKSEISALSPSGRVPLLIEGELRVWDSLAICEWAAERVPSLWPGEPAARAVARSICAEMHSGFPAMRSELSMDLQVRTTKDVSDAAKADVARVQAIWRECRSTYGAAGPYLFGAFTIADAFYAPVVTRFRSYGIPLDAAAARYSEAMFAHPAVRAWCEAGERE